MTKKFIGVIRKKFRHGEKISSGGDLHLDVLMEKDGQYFIAHCLDLDLVAQGKTFEEAKKELIELINDQIDFAVDNNLEELLVHPAPKEYWIRYWNIKSESLKKNLAQNPPSSRIEINKKLDVAYA